MGEIVGKPAFLKGHLDPILNPAQYGPVVISVACHVSARERTQPRSPPLGPTVEERLSEGQ